MKAKPKAVLLLGPTGSGKTPLGLLLERTGLRGMPCAHFDFGVCLRRADKTGIVPSPLGEKDLRVIRTVLQTGALLEKESFPIARALLSGFLDALPAGGERLVILNGLPRHLEQAKGVEDLLDVVRVIHLEAIADTVRERIRRDTGADRGGREDDAPAKVEERLAIFRERTAPLLAHYRAKGVPVETLSIGPETTVEAMGKALEEKRKNGHP
ncbi:MAG: adenylate kinase family protein [Planctomycetota bacterium]|jgi:adenylate kinase family enzyme